MTGPLFESPGRTLLLVAVSLAGIAFTLRMDQSSAARANRLHRAGELDEAAAIYDAHILEDPSAEALRYNLGTTLLRMGSADALAQLAAGADTEDEHLRVRALYNMGLSSLIEAVLARSNDSVLFHAGNAVEANKSALRLDPEHADARWNLALAQRILVTATPEQGPGDTGRIPGPDDIGEIQLSNQPLELVEDEGVEDVTARGEGEALAGEDAGPLSEEEAREVVGTGHRDPSTMIAKLLRREGRSLRRQRIFVEGPPW